jgi:hypothetical protein
MFPRSGEDAVCVEGGAAALVRIDPTSLDEE